MQSQYKNSKRKFKKAQQVTKNPSKPKTRSLMNRESSLVTPIKKTHSFPKTVSKEITQSQCKNY